MSIDAASAGAAETEELMPFDVRLVPAVVVCWSITAVAILGGPGWAVAATAATVAVVLLGALAVRRVATRCAAAGPSWAGVATVIALALCFGGAIWLQTSALAEHPVAAAAHERGWITASVQLEEDPRRLSSAGPAMVMTKAEMIRVDVGGEALYVGGRVSIIGPESSWSRLLPGQEITVRGRLGEPVRPDMSVAVIRASGPPVTVGEPGAVSAGAGTVRSNLAAVAQNSMPPERAGLLPGLVVGDVSHMDETVAENFRAAGLTHLTAVSGDNALKAL